MHDLEGSRSTQRERTHTLGEQTNSTQKGPRSNQEPETLLLLGDGANHHTYCAACFSISTVHNILKGFEESGKISVHQAKGQKQHDL